MSNRALPMKYRSGAITLVAVLVLISAYLYTAILGGSLGSKPYRVDVSMAQSGGLFAGSNVTYRGVHVGKVDRIDQASNGLIARISIQPDAKIPASAKAAVRSLSPAGEQFLDLQPTSTSGPFLKNKSTIAQTQTSAPTSVAEAVRSIDALMADVDENDLRTMLFELRTAFENPHDLQQIIASSSSLIDSLDAMWPQTERLLTNGRTLMRTGIDLSDDVRSFAKSAESLAASLKDYDPSLRSHLKELPVTVDDLRLLVKVMAKDLPPVLKQMIGFTDIVVPRDQALREFLKIFPRGFERFADAVKDGRLNTTMLISNGNVCSYNAGEPLPTDPQRKPLDDSRDCSSPFDGQQRGSANAPQPRK